MLNMLLGEFHFYHQWISNIGSTCNIKQSTHLRYKSVYTQLSQTIFSKFKDWKFSGWNIPGGIQYGTAVCSMVQVVLVVHLVLQDVGYHDVLNCEEVSVVYRQLGRQGSQTVPGSGGPLFEKNNAVTKNLVQIDPTLWLCIARKHTSDIYMYMKKTLTTRVLFIYHNFIRLCPQYKINLKVPCRSLPRPELVSTENCMI